MSDYQAAPTDMSRIEVIDAVRGFALFGLFMVHCVELFELYWANPKSSGVHDAIMFLFNGKSFALFALSFGVSFSIIIRSAQRRGEGFQLRFLWRLAILACIGFMHSLVYRGDILVLLAFFGVSLLLFEKIKSTRVLFFIAAVFVLNPILMWRVFSAMNGGDWASAMPNHYNDPSMPVLLNGSLLETFAANAGEGNIHKAWFYFESGRMSQVLGLFAAGLALGRLQFFERTGALYLRTLFILLIGCSILAYVIYMISVNWLAALPQVDGNFTSNYLGLLLKGWGDVAFAVAQLSGFLAAWHLGARAVLRWLAPPGRMTLSLYVGQSLVFVPILYGFGLGLHDDVTQTQMLWIGIAASITQIVGAAFWMRRFRYGPIEWVWRVLTKLSVEIPFSRGV